ncbi:MAG: helix-turn-helix domain-containing protein [Thomasclavelia spiroformis]
MSVSYKKLWHLLLDRDMKKKDLAELSGISPYTINKLNRDGNVTIEVIEKICQTLNCKVDDILEFLKEEERNDYE